MKDMNKKKFLGLLLLLVGAINTLKAQNENDRLLFENVDTCLVGKYAIVEQNGKKGIYDIGKHECVTPIEFEYLTFIAQQKSDRKSTRLNSSHQIISYAVFCLKKKN